MTQRPSFEDLCRNYVRSKGSWDESVKESDRAERQREQCERAYDDTRKTLLEVFARTQGEQLYFSLEGKTYVITRDGIEPIAVRKVPDER